MAQAQATRGEQMKFKAQQEQEQEQPEAIQYGHVFAVSGDLAVQAIAPRDAAAMRSAEESVPGVPVPQASGGGFSAATAMETAAAYNQAVGAVRPGQASDAATKEGIAFTQTAMPGGRIVTEFVAGQVVGQYSVADPAMMEQQQVEEDPSKVTIGEAMEAAALSAGDRPMEEADAAAIRAAESQAMGADEVMPGGLGDQAWAAASANAWAEHKEDKITISDVLTDATTKMADDKPADSKDAARVVQAETDSDAGSRTKTGGVGAALTTAARLNQEEDDEA